MASDNSTSEMSALLVPTILCSASSSELIGARVPFSSLEQTGEEQDTQACSVLQGHFPPPKPPNKLK